MGRMYSGYAKGQTRHVFLALRTTLSPPSVLQTPGCASQRGELPGCTRKRHRAHQRARCQQIVFKGVILRKTLENFWLGFPIVL